MVGYNNIPGGAGEQLIKAIGADSTLRMIATSYSVGDKVHCPYFIDYAMVCTTAGTTSTSSLSKADVAAGITAGTLTDGTVTWRLDLQTTFEVSIPITDGAINLSNGRCFTQTITDNTTLVFNNCLNSGTVFSVILTNGGSKTITYPSSVKWEDGAPELKASGVDVLTFVTGDSGTTWYGVHTTSVGA